MVVQDFAFAFQCFMLEYWDEKPKHGGRWPVNSSLSPNVSSDPAVMLDVYKQLSKIEPGSETKPWVLSPSLVLGLPFGLASTVEEQRTHAHRAKSSLEGPVKVLQLAPELVNPWIKH